ncbi:hypothetical protein MPER_10091 [Moniliophthora perniciosa FA553]|nr:hypothetical protein MPER_10091 [Moniliophthora perniciosa FA553]
MEAVTRWPRGARSLWEWLEMEGLMEETVLDGGLTRFELVGEEVYLEAGHYWSEFRMWWLSQSSRVFDAIGVTEGKGDFFTVGSSWLHIRSTRFPTASHALRNDEHPTKEMPPTPIYLFLHPLPMSGQSRMSEVECERWELPVLTLSIPNGVWLYSWPTYVYTGLRDWQKARGFHPTTSDWARHMGFPEWEIVGARKAQTEKKAGNS